jgi:hypothetical protein
MFSLGMKIISALVIAFSATILVLGILAGNSHMFKELTKTFGSIAEYTAIATGGLWAVRHVWLYLRKRKIQAADYIREFFLVLKKYHTLLGYTLLALATSHGVYFLLKGTRHMSSMYSGIGALAGLTLAGTVGVMLQKLGTGKKHLKYKRVHQIVAAIFGIGLLIHLTI